MQTILNALASLRTPAVCGEYHVHALIRIALKEAGVAFESEAKLAPRCRVDFLCEGGYAIEVKQGRPPTAKLKEQLRRYAACEQVTQIVLVVERNADLPRSIGGKPVTVVGLRRLWGVAF